MRRAFTTMELLSVIAILAVLGGLSVPFWRNILLRNNLYIAKEQTEQMLRRASILAQGGDSGAWGVYVPDGVLYQGENFASRFVEADEIFPLPSSVNVSGVQDVSFSVLYAEPSVSGDIILEATNGDSVRIPIANFFGKPAPVLTSEEDVYFAISFIDIKNQGKGNATATVHIGPSATLYQENELIPLTQNGIVLTDSGFVVGTSGLAVQRFTDHIFVLAHGDLGENGGKEVVDARITFTNGTVVDVQNPSVEFPTENPFDGNANNGVGGDEVTQEGSQTVLFQSRTTNYGDSISIYWEPAEDRNPWQ